MSTQTYDDVLEHYGIKGMQWGVRRSKKQIRKDTAKRVKEGKDVTLSDDAKKVKQAVTKGKEKGLGSLSNDELNMVNQRLNLEKQYKTLTTTERAKVSAGKKAAKFVAKESGNVALNVAKATAQKQLMKQVAKQLAKGG